MNQKNSKGKRKIIGIVFAIGISIATISSAEKYYEKLYTIENGYVYKTSSFATVSDLKSKENDNNLQVTKKDGTLLSDNEPLATGYQYSKDGNTYTIVIKGDINGDGIIDASDFEEIKEHMVHKQILKDEFEEAGDINSDGEVDIRDVLLFKRLREKAVTGVELDKNSAEIQVGNKITLKATIKPEDAFNKELIWETSDENIATVDSNGNVLGKKVGQVEIKVKTKDGKYSSICNITVKEKELTKIEVSSTPTKTTYIQNYENLDVTGGKIKLTYNDETTEEINMTAEMVSGFNNKTIGEKTLTVAYSGQTATFTVNIVEKELTKIEISSTPTKTTYIQNYENLDVTGGKIKLTYNDETTEEINMTAEMVSGFDNKTIGEQILTVSYNGQTATFTVNIVAKKETKLDKTDIVLEVGESTSLTISAEPLSSSRSYECTVENGNVVKVEKTDNFGVLKITGLQKGTSKVTFVVSIDDEKFDLECNITVNQDDIPVTGIKLDKSEITMNKGETQTITGTIEPDDATNKEFTWSTDNSDVIKLVSAVNGTLTIETQKAGEATITATTKDGGYIASCQVTVVDNTDELVLSESSVNMEKSATITIISNKDVTWKSDNISIAKVSNVKNQSVTVTAIRAGTTKIIATTEDGEEVECEVTVYYPVKGVAINETSEELIVGSTTRLTEILDPINATNQNVTWTSNNESVAIVDNTGKVTGLKAGTAIIQIETEDGNYTATCTINVIEKPSEESTSMFEYTTRGSQVTITGYKGTQTQMIIPEKIAGKTVTTIGSGSVLNGIENVTSVILPDTVQTIQNSAFYQNTNLESIDLKNIISIGDSAFEGCTSLKKISFPEGITSIGGAAFSGCTGLDCDIILPDSLTSMGKKSTFKGCTKIRRVKLSKNCETVPISAFENSSLTGSLEIPEGVVTLDRSCFASTSYTSVKFSDSVKYINSNAFRQSSRKMEGELILPKNLEFWGDGLFDHAMNVTNKQIIIPKSVKTIGGDGVAYIMDGEIVSVSATGYGTHSFYNVAPTTLEEFVVEEGNTNFKAVDGVLYTMDNTRLVSYPCSKSTDDGIYEIIEGAKQFDDLSFSRVSYPGASNSNVKTVKLPSTFEISEYGPANVNSREVWKGQACLNTISGGFYIYNGIQAIEVSEDNPNFKSIDGCVYSKDEKTFWYVPKGKTGELNIQEGTTKIAHGSFAGLYGACQVSISSLHLPASLQYIDEYTLPWINKLSNGKITIDENNPYWTLDDNGDIVAK